MSTPDEQMSKVAKMLGDQRLAMLTTTAEDGTLMSRPMALQEVEFDGDLWFFAERDSRKVAQISGNPQVNVTAGDNANWVSLTGRAELVTDADRKRELWNQGVAAWFPDGPDDDGITLIRVEGASAEYWDTPGGRVSTLVSLAKARLTGQRAEMGENERVDL